MVRLRSAARILALAMIAARGTGSLAAEGEVGRWKAQWITAPGAAERDVAVLHFRKTIELAAQPERFFVDVSADNQFILYVNGKEAGRGPSHGDLAHWRYETLDLAPLLHEGKN